MITTTIFVILIALTLNTHLELGLALLLEVLAVTQKLTGLNKSCGLDQALLLPDLGGLDPWLELLDASLELGPVLHVLRELGTLGLDLFSQGVQSLPDLLQAGNKLLGIRWYLFVPWVKEAVKMKLSTLQAKNGFDKS